MKVFIEHKAAEKLPDDSRFHYTNLGVKKFRVSKGNWGRDNPFIGYWLEEVDILDHVYIPAENMWLPVGAVLTSKENGELTLASPGTLIQEIVGIVREDGIEHYNTDKP